MRKGEGHTVGQAFKKGNAAGRESVLAAVVELQQAKGLASGPQAIRATDS